MDAPAEEADFELGDEVLVLAKYRGVVRFIGPTSFSPGVWYGLEMDAPVGKHEGTVLGVQYFTAGPKRGTFVKEAQLQRYCAVQAASNSIAGLARMSSARRAMKSELVSSAFNRLDADDEAQALARQAALMNTALGQALARGRASEEQLAAWAREAGAMAVEASYAGPALTLPVTTEQAWALTLALRTAQQPLHYKYAMLLLGAYRAWAAGLPALTELTVPHAARLTVVGDTHGQLEDLLTVFSLQGVPAPDNRYLVNGDFVDRGPRGCEVVLVLMAWCLAGVPAGAQGAPHAPGAPLPACHIHRGNHESHSQNSAGGFLSEVLTKYAGVFAGAAGDASGSGSGSGSSRGSGGSGSSRGGSAGAGAPNSLTCALNLYDAFQAAFDCMPLASVITASEAVPAGAAAGSSGGATTARRNSFAISSSSGGGSGGGSSSSSGGGGGMTGRAAGSHSHRSVPLHSTPTCLYLDLPPPCSASAAAAAALPRVFVTHGGLLRDGSATLAAIGAVERRRDIPFGLPGALDIVFEDLMWSDPLGGGFRGTAPSDRGAGVKFGADVTRAFCERNALRAVIRSHEMVQGGCEWMHEGRLLTVFSASRYTGKGDNKGGFICFNAQLRYTQGSFYAAPLESTAPAVWSAASGTLVPRAAEPAAAAGSTGAGAGAGAAPAAAPPPQPPAHIHLPHHHHVSPPVAPPHLPGRAASASPLRPASAAAAAAAAGSAAAAAAPAPHAPSPSGAMEETVRKMLIERIVLRKSELQFFYAAEEAKDAAATRDGSISKAAWAEGLRRVLGLELPWLTLLPMLAAVEPSGRVNYPRFLDRYTIAVRAKHAGWMEGIVDSVAVRLLGSFGSLEDMFQSLDADGSGGIELHELEAALGKLALGLSRAQVAALMDTLDSDRDGRVQLSEFKARFVYTFAALRDDEAGAARRGSSGAGAGAGGADAKWVSEMCTLIGARIFAAGGEDPEAAFAGMDSNKNGLLSLQEFTAGIASLGLQLSHEAITKFVEAIDVNKSGDINYKEFVAAFKPKDVTLPPIATQVAFWDAQPQVLATVRPAQAQAAGGGGSGGAAPAPAPNWQRNIIEKVVAVLYEYRLELAAAFSVFDTNGDGTISAAEFSRTVQSLTSTDGGGAAITEMQALELMKALDSNGDGQISYEEFVAGFRLTDTQASAPLLGTKAGRPPAGPSAAAAASAPAHSPAPPRLPHVAAAAKR